MAMTHFTIEVVDEINKTPTKTYKAEVRMSGVLLMGLKRLQACSGGYFAFTMDPYHGPYLKSVNYVTSNKDRNEYWELLSKDKSGHETPLDVGVEVYQPKEGETIVLKFREIDMENIE